MVLEGPSFLIFRQSSGPSTTSQPLGGSLNMFGQQAPRTKQVQVKRTKPAAKPTETRSAVRQSSRTSQPEMRRGKRMVKSAPSKKPSVNPKAESKSTYSKVEDDPYMPEYIQEIDKPQYELRVIIVACFC